MEWIEADPLPMECQACRCDECYNCDHAGKRWYLSPGDELILKRICMSKAKEHLEKRVSRLSQK